MKRKKIAKKIKFFFRPSVFPLSGAGESVATRRLYREINIIGRMR